jgi:hypothetical protein
MMEKYFLFIKHNILPIWRIIEWGNGVLFSFLYGRKFEKTIKEVFSDNLAYNLIYRKLELSDAESLFNLIKRQDKRDLVFFHPHEFDLRSIRKQFQNKAFLMMGVFDEGGMVGYFFLRFFTNKKCFVGRLIDRSHRGLGIGQIMNHIMYEIGWRMNFRCFSTISRNNTAVIRAHAKNPNIKILKELSNNYLLVEFIRNKDLQ